MVTISLLLGLSMSACGDDENGAGDLGVVDSGRTDTGTTDTGTTDTGATDTGATDTGATDTGATDAGDAGFDSGFEDAMPSDASDLDAGIDAGVDAGETDSGTCSIGIATSSAAVSNPALFGQVFPFANGVSLPAGTYEVSYEDGCFKFASSQWWTIHARADGNTTWWLVGADSTDRKQYLPGTVGYLPGTATSTIGDQNGFEIFADCVTANLALPPSTYVHNGGPLGIWLADTNYPDNIPGEGGRNPAWSLTLLGACPD